MKDKVPWLLEQAASAFFVLLGAAIGFLSAWLKEWLDAKAAKQSFLIAVRHELQALDKQLERSIGELTEAQLRMEKGGAPPQLAPSFQTTVYQTHLGRLKDLSDVVLLDVIKFYSDFSILERMANLLNQQSADAAKQSDGERQRAFAVQIKSSLRVLVETLGGFRGRLAALLKRLPEPMDKQS